MIETSIPSDSETIQPPTLDLVYIGEVERTHALRTSVASKDHLIGDGLMDAPEGTARYTTSLSGQGERRLRGVAVA